jgi:hypothetical protein
MKGKENTMKITRGRIPVIILLVGLISFMVLACRFGASSTSATPTRVTNVAGQNSTSSSEPTTIQQMETNTHLPAPLQTATNTDLSQANLPAGFPLYPGGHDYTWVAGLMLEYTVDVDVRTASGFYAKQMGASGYSDLTGGGGATGECGGDCGPVPTHTPGPTPTSTPEGWMRSTDQAWTKGNELIMINYLVNPDGTTDISIVFSGK